MAMRATSRLCDLVRAGELEEVKKMLDDGADVNEMIHDVSTVRY